MKSMLMILICVIVVNGQTAEEIIKKAENSLKGKTAHGVIEMIVETPDFTREIEMESWWEGNEKALIVIKSPRKEEGNKTLKIGNEMWNYLKNTENTIKVPPSMMLQSWNGSDFTNDDLVRESNLNDDYTMKIIGEEKVNDVLCWKIELNPKPSAPVVWGKLIYYVRKTDELPAKVEYYDEKGKKIRTMLLTNIKKFNGRLIPSEWSMVSNVKEGRSTIIKIKEMEFDININSRIFSFSELERGN
ncbi:MAG: outer membrane lipoprotein-sorting protein [Melioribacteraceae bacterium]|nr:outer membrane lipoprotein-sorting protein [Melioribacteraceae bacterium]